MGKRRYKENIDRNNSNYGYYISRITELSLGMMKWECDIDTIDKRSIELGLFDRGCMVWFEDEVIGPLCLPVIYSGPFDVYGYPIHRRAVSFYNSYQKDLNSNDSVLIYNNLLHTNTYPVIRLFARRLWQLDQIVDINANSQKTPILIQCSENDRLTAKNMYANYDGNEPVIFVDKGFNTREVLNVLKTDSPYVADKIYQLKVNIFNECLTYLGIPNSNIVKKERQLQDEVIRDMAGTIASRNSRIEARQEACIKINKMFGINIWVDVRSESEIIQYTEETEKMIAGHNISGENNE